MFALLQPLAAGNAIRLFLAPPAGVESWRILRRTSDTFTGPDDAGAVVVADGREETVLDRTALVNGIPYFYRVFYRSGGDWLNEAGSPGTATPEAGYQDDGCDPQAIVRERLRLGLEVEVKRGTLKPASGRIPVIAAPFATVEKITFPCVSVHVDLDQSADRAIGETLDAPVRLPGGGWELGPEGWLSRVTLNIVATSLNMEERAVLRRAIQRIVQANLPIFDDAGMLQIDLRQKDLESQEPQSGASLYHSAAQLSCLAAAFVTSEVSSIADVLVSATTPDPMGTADQ